MSSSNDENHAFWKPNLSSLPGSIKLFHHNNDENAKLSKPTFSLQSSTEQGESASEDINILLKDLPFQLSVDKIRETALEVIKNHSKQSGDVTINFEDKCHIHGNHDHSFVKTLSCPQDLITQNSNSSKNEKHLVASSNSITSPKVVVNRTSQNIPHVPGKMVRSISKNNSSTKSEFFFETEMSRIEKINAYMNNNIPNLESFQKLCWSGIPHICRSTAWKILSSYTPLLLDRREMIINKKRQEYYNLVDKYYETRKQAMYAETYHQIHIDIPRMSPLIPLFQQQLVQEIFERILYIWAIRHPASGYVQGINDLVTPFFVVFLSEHVPPDTDIRTFKIDSLPLSIIKDVEADSFWCFSKLLDGIQNNYTFAQPGIQRQVLMLKELMMRINNKLHQHLIEHHIEYLQFAFRWMNNLLMREMSLMCVIRLWDTYLCETDGFASFHLYVCAALLNKFSTELLEEKDFQGLMLYLKNLPTDNWTDDDVRFLLADAYRLKFAFADAPNHLKD